MAGITTLLQKIEVTDVGSIIITEPTETEDSEGNPIYVREIRVFDIPESGFAETAVVTLRLISTVEDNIKLSAPVQTF